MSTDRNDVYRAAKYLIERNGVDAGERAAASSDRMYRKRDLEGLVMRKNIERAVADLQRTSGVPAK